MFEDSLLESGGRLKTHRAATTFASLLMQSALVGLLLLMPLIFTEAMPAVDWTKPLELPPSAPAPRGPERIMQIVRGRGSEIDNEGRLVAPHEFPPRVRMFRDAAPPGPGPADDVAVPDGRFFGSGLGGDDPNSVLRTIISENKPIERPAPGPAPHAVPSVLMQGRLIHRVIPPYPQLARNIRAQGPVVMRAVISREGRIENLQVIAGHPALRRAALDAVSQWRYRPYILNGQPVQVETQITFNFVLGSD